ncbi:phosphatidic acid phosphatase type 2/haloperoxidase [Gilbertella persicaria]|uniref:phosphatidic acid phosphatase type 2/haloperoxidase n=1 Tax=Gilbertella persicaria TaxID=101096 RepID=UPI002220D4D3|nr:phosphatidic acid phosphatase type 2/haloperoxidase [Gilbertella persicaria]KAI8090240.1 phosphatidic acid phosphatase type 2/haloperoxidase [Gilbertella persicaria]
MRSPILNILSYTREIVIICTFFTLLYLQSIHVVYFIICAILTTLIAKVLKKIIKQPRPQQTKKKTSYGMPSSHSAAISFFTTYLQCVVMAIPGTKAKLFMLAFHCFSLAVIWSRVSLGHHTRAQVIAGTFLGIVCASISFMLWQHYLPVLLQ